MKKLTKREILEAIANFTVSGELGCDPDVVAEFCAKEIEALDNKAAKAKERAAVRRAEGDALRDAIQSVLTAEYQTVNDIMMALPEDIEDVTPQKVVYRLNQLASPELGIVIKDKRSVENENGKGKRSLTVYALA